MTYCFLLKGEEPAVYIPCNGRVIRAKHFFSQNTKGTIEQQKILFCSDLIETREQHVTFIFDYLKEINTFGKL